MRVAPAAAGHAGSVLTNKTAAATIAASAYIVSLALDPTRRAAIDLDRLRHLIPRDAVDAMPPR